MSLKAVSNLDLTADPQANGFAAPKIEGDPRHIAIIMDGNGRWAKKRLLPRKLGHREGAEAVRRTVDACIDRGIPYLTLYAFSSENWSRPQDEVSDLMDLMRRFVTEDIAELETRGVRGCFIGDRSAVDADIRARMEEAETRTAGNTAITVTVAFSYGSHREIALAARALAERVVKGEISPADITEQMVGHALQTDFLPDPDLLIRTSGEQRLSNFLLWQCAYTELYFPKVLWPDFDEHHLADAIQAYRTRDRRYGGRPGEG